MTEANHADKHEQHRPYWAQQYLELAEPLLAYARKLVNRINIGEPEDVVSISACHTLYYAPDPKTVTKPRSYLYRSVHNAWADEVKRSRVGVMESLNNPKSTKAMEEQLPPVEPEVRAILKNEELRQEAEKLGPLTPAEKFLLASVLKGQTIEDIADVLGEDVYRTKTRWYRLVNKLRYRLLIRNETARRKDRT